MPVPIGESGLTVKQKKFCDTLIENQGNGTKAALEAYDTDEYFTAASISYENLKKPQILKYIAEKCAKADLSVDNVLGRLRQELDAVRPLQGTTGQIIDTVPDWTARHNAILTAIKYVLPEFAALKAATPANPGPIQQHVHLHSVPTKRLKEIVQSSAQLLEPADDGDQSE